MPSAYVDLLGRLFAARRFGVILGLDRMRALLDALGAPDRRLGTVIHVGGTNGKGSTVAMIAELARAAGLRVAAYTSPHLCTVRERIALPDGMISEDEMVLAADAVRDHGGDEYTFFEQLTAIACVAMAEVAPEVTVLEVGLGGRLDATNAIAAPIAVVTGAAMDHEAILGPTLEAIAGEKAGIWKAGQRCVIGASGEDAALATLVGAARRAGVASAVVIGPSDIARVPPVALPGEHQRRNAAAALAAIDALEEVRGLRVSPEARAAALARVHHPGRFEVIPSDDGEVILDGAHNPHGAAALADTLRARGLRPVLVVAASADKDAAGIAAALAPAVRAVVATRYRQDRAMAPADLAAAFARAGATPVHEAPDLAAALAVARGLGGPVLVAGSLFLVGEARTLLLGAPTDPFVVTDPAAVTR